MNLNCLQACVECSKYCLSDYAMIRAHRLNPSQLMSLRQPESTQVVYIREGVLTVSYDDHEYEVVPGSLFLVPKNNNAYCIAKEEAMLIEMTISPNIDLCSARALDSLKSEIKFRSYTFSALKCTSGLNLYFDYVHELLMLSMMCRSLHELLTIEFLLCIKFEYSIDTISQFFHPIIQEIDGFKDSMRRYTTPKTTAKELAEVAKMPYIQFLKYFKGQFGISAQQCLKAYKVQQLEERLNEKEVIISDLVMEFGFSSSAHLTKYCLKNMGVTPSDYIARISEMKK